MWYSAEPLSPSSWLNAQVPTSRSPARSWIAIDKRVRPDDPGREEALDLLGPHRGFLVAGQPGDLRIGVPAAEPGQVLRDVPAQHDPRAPHDLREPRSRRHRRNRIPSPPCAAGATWPSASRRRPGRPRRPRCWPTTCAASTPDELPIAAVFLTGRPFPEADQRATGLGWSAIASAVAEVAGVSKPELGQAYDRHSDLSLAVEDVLTAAGHDPDPDPEPDAPRGGRHVRGASSRRPARRASPRCCATCSPAPTRDRHAASSRSSAATCGSACARGSWRPPSPRRSIARSTRSSGPAC